MAVARSSEDLQNIGRATESDLCVICSEPLEQGEDVIETKCKHVFHKRCFRTWLETSGTCPICRAPCSIVDLTSVEMNVTNSPSMQNNRSVSARARQGAVPRNRPATRRYAQQMNRSNDDSVSINNHLHLPSSDVQSNGNLTRSQLSEERVHQIVQESLGNFRVDITSAVSGELQAFLKNLNLGPDNPPPSLQIPREEIRSNSRISGESIDVQRPQRVPRNREIYQNLNDHIPSLISNWKIKFSGNEAEMSVDDFIYRIRSLTERCLDGNYELLCRYAYLLFSGNAERWYWRIHRQSNNLSWRDICVQLRQKFGSNISDYELKENIRRRKQKTNESFDQYVEVVQSMNDRLLVPMYESELVETLKRNLLPSIQLEILHLNIDDMSSLREECHKHEIFYQQNPAVKYQNPY